MNYWWSNIKGKRKCKVNWVSLWYNISSLVAKLQSHVIIMWHRAPQASDLVVPAAGGDSPPEEEGVLTAERWVSPLAVDSVEKTSFSSTVTSTPLSPSEPVWGLRIPSSPSWSISPCSSCSSSSFCREHRLRARMVKHWPEVRSD